MQYGSVADVKQAIDLLYNSRDNSIQQTANSWLQLFQRQPEAWDVASQLLTETNTTYVFFGAHTICNKIRYDFNELSSEQAQQLLTMLFNYSKSFNDKTISIRNQLCLCIVTLLLRWSDVRDIVSVAVQNIGASGNDYMLLNVLSMLPTEVRETRLPIFDEQRDMKIEDMKTNASNVLQYINGLLQSCSNDEQIVEMVFSCFKAWVSLNCFSAEELASTTILPSLFKAIHIPSLFDVCSDALSEVLHLYYTQEHQAVINIILPEIAGMQPLARTAVDTGDYEMCRRIVLIFTQLGDDYIIPVMNETNTLKDELLETLLILYSFPSMDIAEICVDFWSDLLVVMDYPRQQSAVMNLLMRLVDETLAHLQFDESIMHKSNEDIFDMRKQRHEIGELINKCAELLGKDALFDYFQNLLSQALNEYVAKNDDAKQHEWMKVESLIYVLKLVGAPYDVNLNTITGIVSALISLPPNTFIDYSTLRLISCYCTIFRDISILQQILNYFYSKIDNSALHQMAAEMFYSLCKDCKTVIISDESFAVSILSINHSLPSQMSRSDKCTMMKGLCLVIRALPQQDSMQYIKHYLDAQLMTAQTVLSAQPSLDGAATLIEILQLLTVIIQYSISKVTASCTESICQYFKDNFSLFTTICQTYINNEDVIEEMCRFFKYLMRMNRDQFLPLLEMTVNLVMEGYSHAHIGSFLYCGSVIIGEYGSYESCKQLILNILNIFTSSTLPMLSQGIKMYNQNPNLVEDFYDLCGRTLQQHPDLIFNNGDLCEQLTQAAICGIQLQHREANNSIMRFLESLLSYGYVEVRNTGEGGANRVSYIDRVRGILNGLGQYLMNELIGGLTGGLPESRLHDSNVSVISVLYNFYDYFGDLFVPLISATIAQIPEKLLSATEKEHFMQSLCAEKTTKVGWFENVMMSLSRIIRRRMMHE